MRVTSDQGGKWPPRLLDHAAISNASKGA